MLPHEENLAQVQVPDKPVLWRREMFLKLGFTQPQAHKLADAKDALGLPVYWGDVDELLQMGCPHDIAFDIYSDDVIGP